jgi:RNA polymerase sigma-70 factor (ECF subfamily)
MKPLVVPDDRCEATGYESSDGSLLRRFQAGSDQAATDLYLRYARRIFRLAESSCGEDLRRRLDADDIVQSVFSSFFRRARNGGYEVPDGEEIWGLLLVMALNKIRARGNFHRAACRDVRATQSSDALEQTASHSRHDEMALVSLRLTVDDVLRGQPELDRQIVRLRIEGFEVAEIASRVARSRRTVERVLQEFRRQLQASLQQEAEP